MTWAELEEKKAFMKRNEGKEDMYSFVHCIGENKGWLLCVCTSRTALRRDFPSLMVVTPCLDFRFFHHQEWIYRNPWWPNGTLDFFLETLLFCTLLSWSRNGWIKGLRLSVRSFVLFCFFQTSIRYPNRVCTYLLYVWVWRKSRDMPMWR